MEAERSSAPGLFLGILATLQQIGAPFHYDKDRKPSFLATLVARKLGFCSVQRACAMRGR